MTAPEPREFDVCGPLPSGVTVLEASAGTGKTYTIAALAARYVAEGIPLERLLLVTLHPDRDRRAARAGARAAGRASSAGLAAALAGARARIDDRSSRCSPPATPSTCTRERLARAVASFDAATIATTHGFCQEVLGGLGIAGDLEPDVTFVEDLSDTASTRSSTTSTCAGSTAADRPGVPLAPRRRRSPARRSTTPRPLVTRRRRGAARCADRARQSGAHRARAPQAPARR